MKTTITSKAKQAALTLTAKGYSVRNNQGTLAVWVKGDAKSPVGVYSVNVNTGTIRTQDGKVVAIESVN